MEVNGIKIFRAIVFGGFFILLTVFIIVPWIKADRYFVDLSYHNAIQGIEIRPGHRGNAHILIDSVWRLILVDELKIQDYLQVGDSIVKEAGERRITVFRKVSDHTMMKREFE